MRRTPAIRIDPASLPTSACQNFMPQFVLKTLLIGSACVCGVAIRAQQPATSAAHQDVTPASAAEVEALRQQVQSLTELVKTLQQQIKDQPPTGGAANNTPAAALPQNPESSASPAPAISPSSALDTGSAAATGPQLFPTEDASVVSSAAPPPAGNPSVSQNNAAAGSFPTSDTSVVQTADSSSAAVSAGPGSSLTTPITLGGGRNYMNISLDGLFAAAGSTASDLQRIEVGDHDPQQRGFNARNIELAFDGAVDPYFEGFANIVFKLNNDNGTEVEVEEAFMQTTNLPFNLQLKGGQFFAPFGRINPIHPHIWDFADAPVVAGRLLGPDGLRGVGGQIAWTVPLPWYAQALFAIQNGRGGTAYSFRNPGENGLFFNRPTNDRELRGLGDLLWVPRLETSVDLTSTQLILAGVSGAFGANDTGPHTHTQIYGADLLYKWKSSHADAGFPFVKWQTEFMYRRYEAGHGAAGVFPVAETFHDWGMYSQVLWGFKKGWVTGIRGDYLHNTDSRFTDDPDRQTRSRITADLTWYPTEFSKLRLQYNHDFLADTFFLAGRNVDSVFLQFEFILGAHGAHKF